ncbi:MAG: hypothetical protein QM723_16125 [Myxococcaceae bacterium]
MRSIACIVSLLALPALADAVAGINWKAPEAWKKEADRPMRAATYTIAPVKGDTEGAECGVFFFGSGQGGSVEANIQRWAGQFEGAKAPAPKQEKIAGFEVSSVQLEGTYTPPNMMNPNAPKTPKPGTELYAFIVTAPEGNVFFKLSGPKKTVEAAKADFSKMIKGLTKS